MIVGGYVYNTTNKCYEMAFNRFQDDEVSVNEGKKLFKFSDTNTDSILTSMEQINTFVLATNTIATITVTNVAEAGTGTGLIISNIFIEDSYALGSTLITSFNISSGGSGYNTGDRFYIIYNSATNNAKYGPYVILSTDLLNNALKTETIYITNSSMNEVSSTIIPKNGIYRTLEYGYVDAVQRPNYASVSSITTTSTEITSFTISDGFAYFAPGDLLIMGTEDVVYGPYTILSTDLSGSSLKLGIITATLPIIVGTALSAGTHSNITMNFTPSNSFAGFPDGIYSSGLGVTTNGIGIGASVKSITLVNNKATYTMFRFSIGR